MTSSENTSVSDTPSDKHDSSTTTFDNDSIDTPYLSALLCAASYNSIDENNIELDGVKFTYVRFYDIHDIQFFTCQRESEKSLYIIFRGTDSLRDMMVDMNITRENTGFGKIHQGFLNSWVAVRHEVISRVFKDDCVYNTVKFFGHSYGGALANIAAVYIGSLTEKKIHCQTFGCPRVGDNEFCRSSRKYIDIHKRFIDKGDPIIHLPMFIRFTHASPAIVLNDAKLLSKIIHYYKLYIRKDRLFEMHRISHYIELTKRYQTKLTF